VADDGDVISVETFESRLTAICSGGTMLGLPRRRRDIAIILASATLWMETGAIYTEPEINEGLSRWLTEVCPSLALDEVTLRRELVDNNYLQRDDAGAHYTPGPGSLEWRFDDGIATIDPAQVVADARRHRAERKKEHMARQEDD
jgi:hypothetical protein